MYCSLSEVWGNNNCNDNIYRYNDNNKFDNNKIDNNKIDNNKMIEHFNNKENNKLITCDNFLNHIVDCINCQKKLTEKLCKKDIFTLFNFKNIDKETKETIIIFFIGIILIIILKLIFD